MPRKAFREHLAKALAAPLPSRIDDLREGADDGQIDFAYLAGPTATIPVHISALIPDLSDYPSAHSYMLFSEDGTSQQHAQALERVRGTDRKTISELLEIVSASMSPDADGDTPMQDSQSDPEELEEFGSDEDDVYDSDHEAFGPPPSNPTNGGAIQSFGHTTSTPAFRKRIRSDLTLAKTAGFKVGHLGHLMEGSNAFVTISVRMTKLGISDEAMEAWKLEPNDYLVLIIQYPNGYKTNEELQNMDGLRVNASISMRVCAGKHYKPTLQQAIKAFTSIKKDSSDSTVLGPQLDDGDDSLKEMFISKPLTSILQERLLSILRYRSSGIDWRAAEKMFEKVASASRSSDAELGDAAYEPDPVNLTRPDIVNADHLKTHKTKRMEYSLPLMAMQFLLRHFVRCTEFCLVCHKHLDSDLEAIKPYVCENSLCLYQYMTLGFGPSIEYEILTQPYVVDLLISFCYNSAWAKKLKDFPDGLALVVPPVSSAGYAGQFAGYGSTAPIADTSLPTPIAPTYEVGYEASRNEMIFHNLPDACPVKKGSWIVLKVTGAPHPSELHCRVADTTFYPTVSLDPPITVWTSAATQIEVNGPPKAGNAPPPSPAATPKWQPASFQTYCLDFQELSCDAKSNAICRLLETLPDVKEMQKRLSKSNSADLKRWPELISPAALSLLRWIIASNRACIMQVDGDDDGSARKAERVSGMKNYMQFRFAMGAPDKEQRFMQAVRSTNTRLNTKFPSIFAWHGSPLANWHMIIREGLHFKNVDHGRAYGHGVYHAKDAGTSTGYSNRVGSVSPGQWPGSVLRVSSALALNELVNAPAEFVSNNPFYVVPQLDWIQTRYLFVSCMPKPEKTGISLLADTVPSNQFGQDPSATPHGLTGPIAIPASALKARSVSGSRAAPTSDGPSWSKKLKLGGGRASPIVLDDDAESEATDEEDLVILREEKEELVAAPAKKENVKKKGAATDFQPGSLDFASLSLMPLPTYAVPGTTTRLMKELQNLSKAQQAAATADLGWYIDVEKIENMYQWIVELHSFHMLDPKLQLVADMKKKDIKSIVLEIRFNKDFPFSPPYIRVVRPRFLTLAQGGGGHIVMGGAMCMELLTNTGWSSVSSMESVLMQVRLAIASDPPAKLDMSGRQGDYGVGEAADGYLRACQTHGWQVPEGFREMAYSGGKI